MSSGFPPPPPPPPPPAHIPNNGDQNGSADTIEDERDPVREIYNAIQRLPKWREEEDLENKSTWLAVQTDVDPLIQEGPTCGLVVLKLALKLLNKEIETEVEDLFQEAKNRNFTLQGEMFSAQNMLDLVTKVHGCSGQILSGGIQKHKQTILTSLNNMQPVLVPYDADFNHEPSCRGGHRAHWSLLTGYLVRVPHTEVDIQQIQSFGFSPLNSVPTNLLVSSPSSLQTRSLKPLPEAEEDLFVFTRQGKSKHLGVWSFTSLADSNNNLKEFTPSKDSKDFVIPPGGVKEGLCGKAVILQLY